ncbi:hypothetical protein lacNasYZ03_01480 [Lactobacillus nasalidis]|uniref:Uncharacterized protein n=1 Tax=Lactobacillus nasalidis TaxID=2797258 RepID=A0ABQ3W2U1_9LACO|nr:hypothetical protein [Lactobacillus nasalidis]GHW00461.1 hypothetical protein lacNasYZ03_01480 [Lactobacillus nasalidis]
MRKKNWLSWQAAGKRAQKQGQQLLYLQIDNESGQALADLLVLAVPTNDRVSLSHLTEFFPINGPKPCYFYRTKLPAGKSAGLLTSTSSAPALVSLFQDQKGIYWFKGNRGQIEKVGTAVHFKKLLRQIGLNGLKESQLPAAQKKQKKTQKKTPKTATKKKKES